MRINKLSIIVVALLLPLTIQAQKKKPVIKKPIVVTPTEPEEDPRITEMRELTQQIVFVDSVVVSKGAFLNSICLSSYQCVFILQAGGPPLPRAQHGKTPVPACSARRRCSGIKSKFTRNYKERTPVSRAIKTNFL